MDGFWQALMRTEWLVGAAVATVIIGLVGLIALYKPYVVPIKTHTEQLEAEKTRADKAVADAAAETERIRAEYAERFTNFRNDHNQRLEFAERMFQTSLTQERRYSDDWKASAHISQENARISEDRWDEVVETSRLTANVINAMYAHVTGRAPIPPALPPGS